MRIVALSTLLGIFAGCTGMIGGAEPEKNDPAPTASVPAGVDRGLRLPRLSHLQWARTARVFLRLPETPSVAFRPDVVPDGAFETDDRGRYVDEPLIREYRAAADQLTDAVLDDSAAYARFIADAGEGDANTRLRRLLPIAWKRAYRRPLTSEEIERYVTLGEGAPDYATATNEDERLRAMLRVLVRMALQSPHFVYRVELGDPATETKTGAFRTRKLSALEYATRLSYALFNAPPDDELLAMDLTTEEAAAKLLADPRANEVLLAFNKALYGVDASRSMRKDSTKFPGMEGLGGDAANEAERFLDETLKQGGGLRDVLLSRKTYVNRRLASIYGLPLDGLGDSFEPRELASERAGILTRVSWTASEADLVERSSILRGVFVTRKLFCTSIGAPPAGAESEARTPPATLTTNREKVSYRTGAEKCRGCHESIINPSGFAFEHFDAVGRYVTEENGTPVDASGTVEMDGAGKSFNSARTFLEAAAETTAAHECYVGNLATWMLGRPLRDLERADANKVAAHSRDEKLSVRALVQQLVTSESFRSIVVEEP